MYELRVIDSDGGSLSDRDIKLLERRAVERPRHTLSLASSQMITSVRPVWRPELIDHTFEAASASSGGYAQRGEARLRDVLIAACALLFFAPLMALVALSIVATSRGPVFFSHPRIGFGGRSFNCMKFRTMRVDSQAALAAHFARNPAAKAEWDRSHKLEHDPRLSAIGAFLRKTSIDELPQIFNVLMGDMSIVGPRPIVAEEVLRYRRYFRNYCAVKPGITGLWQISGRSSTTYRRRIACDVSYVRTRSNYRDAVIILQTIPAVLFGRGAC